MKEKEILKNIKVVEETTQKSDLEKRNKSDIIDLILTFFTPFVLSIYLLVYFFYIDFNGDWDYIRYDIYNIAILIFLIVSFAFVSHYKSNKLILKAPINLFFAILRISLLSGYVLCWIIFLRGTSLVDPESVLISLNLLAFLDAIFLYILVQRKSKKEKNDAIKILIISAIALILLSVIFVYISIYDVLLGIPLSLTYFIYSLCSLKNSSGKTKTKTEYIAHNIIFQFYLYLNMIVYFVIKHNILFGNFLVVYPLVTVIFIAVSVLVFIKMFKNLKELTKEKD